MSSEALERATVILDSLCEGALEVPLANVYGLNRDGLLQDYAQSCDFFALAVGLDAFVGEVARLEQERDETRETLAALTRSAVGNRDGRWKAEADLAAARAREQRAVDALRREIRHRMTEHEGWAGKLDDAVEAALAAALADQPAADECDGSGECRAAVHVHGCFASAAADEPGEKP